jgi:hypothetical protein
MQSDNKVSSFLLLILIGLGIYLLLNRGEGFRSLDNLKSVYPREPFEDVNSQEVNNNVINQNMPTDSQEYVLPSQEYLAPTQEYVVPTQEYVLPNSQEYVVPTQEYGLPNSQEYVVPTQEYGLPNSQEYVAPSMQGSSIFNFEPNDDSIFNNAGSVLTDAFAPPIPSGTSTDSVNFKKQNMDNYNAKDFLPHEINDEWFETDFSLAKYQLNDDKLINTERYIIGINTVGQSLKNASYDIRGTIPNPKFVVSPWGNSTYEPDFNLKPLC